MSFAKIWSELQINLKPGTIIRNWTSAKGYLGDEFKVITVASTHIEVDSPNAETFQRVSKNDFEFMFNNWNQYCAGNLKRQDLVKKTRVSKYTMSMLKHLSV